MRVGADSVMATIRAAASEQRAAALALDPARLNAANERLSAAIARAKEERVAEVPPDSFVLASLKRELTANAEVIARGQASGNRATQALAEAPALYGQSGAPAPAATVSKPIAAA